MADWSQIVADLHAAEDDVDRAVAASSALDAAADASRLPELHRLLDDEDFFVREAAALPIARLEGLRALPDLMAAYQRGREEGHDNDGLSTVMVSLVESAPGEAAPLLLLMLGHWSEGRRSVAAWLMGFVPAAMSPEPLLVSLTDSSPQVRASAAGALATFDGQAGVFDGLSRALKTDADEQVRVSAAASLGFLADERVIPTLREALTDPAERVREFARHGIARRSKPSP